MGEATSQAGVAGFLPFREKITRRKAEKEPVRVETELPSSSTLAVAPTHGPEVQVPQDAGTQAETSVPCVPDALAQPIGSSTTPIFVEEKEKAAESMPPPPARKEIVMALRAPSAAPIVQPKGRKRKFTKGHDGESSQKGGLNLAPGFRGKVHPSLWIFTLSSLVFFYFLALPRFVSLTVLLSRSSCHGSTE